MSLAQGNNTPTRPRIEPGSPDPESDALTIFTSENIKYTIYINNIFLYFTALYIITFDMKGNVHLFLLLRIFKIEVVQICIFKVFGYNM